MADKDTAAIVKHGGTVEGQLEGELHDTMDRLLALEKENRSMYRAGRGILSSLLTLQQDVQSIREKLNALKAKVEEGFSHRE